MSSRDIVVQAEGLGKIFMNEAVLRNVNLRLYAKECLVVTGENGSGKTTLLRCLSGAIRPTCGWIHWPMAHKSLRCAPADRIGFVAHESHLYGRLTVRENLIFAARMQAVERPHARVDEVLCDFGLKTVATQSSDRLSRGLRQRASIAQALVHRPALLLMDEPFTSLDYAGCQWLKRLLEHLVGGGCSVCLTTHRPGEVGDLATRCVELRDGCAHVVEIPQSLLGVPAA